MKRLVTTGTLIVAFAAVAAASVSSTTSPEDVLMDSGFDGVTLNDTGVCTGPDATYAGDGGPGCAGYGGVGGTGGQGGGAAIALFASGASDVTMKNGGGLFVGFGGTGGAGGSGALGAGGHTGPTGASVNCGGDCDSGCSLYVLNGGMGGVGGLGGTGGYGGGGAGGPLFFFATSGAASIIVPPPIISTSAFEGTPGAGGLPNGLDGGEANHSP